MQNFMFSLSLAMWSRSKISTVVISTLLLSSFQYANADVSKIFLRIDVTYSNNKTKKWTLKCGPTGGNHPYRQKSCNFLLSEQGKSVLFPKQVEACTKVFGGTAVAAINGRFENTRIKLNLDRKDGCGIETWDSLIQILRAK
jgi:hypothetical protein